MAQSRTEGPADKLDQRRQNYEWNEADKQKSKASEEAWKNRGASVGKAQDHICEIARGNWRNQVNFLR